MKIDKSFLIILACITLITPIIQYHIQLFGYFGVSAVFINDTSSYWGNLIRYDKGIKGNYYTLIGVIVLYYPAIFFSWIYCVIINSTLLLLSCNYFLKTLESLKICIPKKKYLGLFLIILFNFYIWGVLYFPNKEIPLIFLTNLLIFNIVKYKKKVLSLYPIILIFFFRDGYSFILLLSVLILWSFENRIIKSPFKFLVIIILILMFFSLKDLSKLQILSNYQYVVDRNINYEVDTKFAANLPYYISYLINLFNNSVVYAVRAQLFDLEYRLYFHGIGIWQFAVVLTSAFFFWIKILKNQYFRKNKIFHIGLIIILSYLFLSTSTYPQVRYMMPFIFWLVVPIFLYLDLRDVILLFYLFLIIAIFIIFLGLSHKPGTGIDIDNFSKNLFIN
jgi:hypothetical protein